MSGGRQDEQLSDISLISVINWLIEHCINMIEHVF